MIDAASGYRLQIVTGVTDCVRNHNREMDMLRNIALLCLIAIVSGSAFASPVGCGYDGINLAFEPSGLGAPCLIQTDGTFTMYIVLTLPTVMSGVSGWECHLEQDGIGALVSNNWTIPGNALNLSTPPDFIVGLGIPLPYDDAIVLASVEVTITGTGIEDYDCAQFWLRAADTPSIPDAPCYVAAHDAGLKTALTPCTAGLLANTLDINCGPCWVETEESTWGAIKRTYR